MSDLKLYQVANGSAVELEPSASKLERDLQLIIEENMETFFGVRLLQSEFSTGPVHGGRMDSIGIDESGTPVIFEYKRNVSESVINQGLFYLDWLLDHRGDFTMLVINTLGAEVADTIDFTSPRLVCVANAFTRYDEHAVRQMGRSIDLVRYQQFEGDLISLELFASTTAGTTVLSAASTTKAAGVAGSNGSGKYATFVQYLDSSPQEVKDLYQDLCLQIEAMGDDITMKMTKYYVNFRRLKSFVSIEVYPQKKKLMVYVKVDPAAVELEDGFSRDVTNIGHLGNGNLELTLASPESLVKALPLIQISYEAN